MIIRRGPAIIFSLFLLTAALSAQTVPTKAIQSFNQGLQLYDNDQILEGIRSFQDAVQNNPNYSDAYREIARGFFYLDEYDEARQYIEKALQLAPRDSRNRSLYGRILITLGEVGQAETIFRDILADEPYNSSARIGLGELSVAKGDIISAGDFYRDSLSLNPDDRRVLLSLAFIYLEQGRRTAAEEYINATVAADSQNPWVHYYAAEFYASLGEYEKARIYAMTALQIRSDFYPALELLSQVLVQQGKYSQALDAIDRLDFTRLRDPDRMFYTKAMAEYNSGDSDAALRTLDKALGQYPDDELSRLLMEDILLQNFDMQFENPLRLRYAEYHFNLADEYMQRNRYDSALYELHRGLTLAPLSERGRRLYADLFRQRGEYARYLDQLKFISDQLKVSDTNISDDISIYTDILQDSVSVNWGVDQFSADRNKIALAVFSDQGSATPIHAGADALLGKHLMDELYLSDYVEFVLALGVDPMLYDIQPVSGNTEAFQTARTRNAEYYLLFSMDESGDSVELRASLHLARTGRTLREFRVIRSGVGRVKDAVQELSNQIIAALPLRGTLMRRNFEKGLINLGYQDGLKVGDKMLIFKTGDLKLYTEDSVYSYNQDDTIGTATVTAVDYLLSEVSIEHNGFFDRISRGDVLIPAPAADGASGDSSTSGAATAAGTAGGSSAGAASAGASATGILNPPLSYVSDLYQKIRGIR